MFTFAGFTSNKQRWFVRCVTFRDHGLGYLIRCQQFVVNDNALRIGVTRNRESVARIETVFPRVRRVARGRVA